MGEGRGGGGRHPREGQQGRETECVPDLPQPVPCIRGRVRVTASWGRGQEGQAGEGQGTPVRTCWGSRVQLFPADERALIDLAAVTDTNPQSEPFPPSPSWTGPRAHFKDRQ